MNQRDIFVVAIENPDSAARAAYLAQACGGDANLRRHVEALLRAHDSAGDFLDRPAVEQLADDMSVLAGREEGVSQSQAPTRRDAEAESQGAEQEEAEELAFLQPSRKSGSLGRLGHYEVLEVLGRGGFAIVVRAFDDVLQRVVAIKVLSAQIALTSPARKRFLREARAAAAVRNDHVVQIYAVEERPRPYLVMEYVPGQTLQQKLNTTGPLETSEMLRLAVQIVHGLAAAHAQGLIHRDIKPSNILLEPGTETKVKLTDFGLARTVDDASLTQSGVIAGTPLYMAPEQAHGEHLDHRTDLFSLGSVLYEMLTGRPPFRAPTTLAVLKRVCDDTPRSIREIIPEVPPWLCDLIAKLHAKKPDQRLQTAQEVADLLAQPPAESGTQGRRSYDARPRRWKWLVAAGLLVAIALTLGLTAKRLTNLATAILGLKGGGSTSEGRVEDPPEPPDAPAPPNPTEAILKKTLAGHLQQVNSVAYSPDGRFLASGDIHGEVRVWNMPDGDLQYPPLNAHGRLGLPVLAFSPDSKFLSTASTSVLSGDIRIWEAETGKTVDVLEGHTKGLFELSFGPHGKTLVSGGWDRNLLIWDFAERSHKKIVRELPVGERISSVVVSVDGKIGVGGPDKTLLLGANGDTIRLLNQGVGHLCFSPDGRLLAGTTYGRVPGGPASSTGNVVVWNVETGETVRNWHAHNGTGANGVAFSRDGRVLATAGSDYCVMLWDMTTLQLTPESLAKLPHDSDVCQIAFAPDGVTLATTEMKTRLIKLWDISFLRSLRASGQNLH